MTEEIKNEVEETKEEAVSVETETSEDKDPTPKVGRFIGPGKIIALEDYKVDGYTLVTVEGAKGIAEEIYANDILPKVVRRKSYDLSTLRENRMYPVAEAILEVMLKKNVKISEVEYLLGLVRLSIDEHIKDSRRILYGREEGAVSLVEMNQLLDGSDRKSLEERIDEIKKENEVKRNKAIEKRKI